jgi:hypothetical protein
MLPKKKRIMKNLLRFIFINTFIIAGAFSQSKVNFGEIYVQVNDDSVKTYVAESVLLYQNVAIEYDTTVQVRSEKRSDYYFYPQLIKGESIILHLILTAKEKTRKNVISIFDVYFYLGDSLGSHIEIQNADSSLYIYPSGQYIQYRLYSRNQNAVFNIVKNDYGIPVAGDFQTEFEYILPGISPTEYSKIKMSGQLSIPQENLRVGQETAIEGTKPHKSSLGRNLAIVAVAGLFILIFAIQ